MTVHTSNAQPKPKNSRIHFSSNKRSVIERKKGYVYDERYKE